MLENNIAYLTDLTTHWYTIINAPSRPVLQLVLLTPRAYRVHRVPRNQHRRSGRSAPVALCQPPAAGFVVARPRTQHACLPLHAAACSRLVQ